MKPSGFRSYESAWRVHVEPRWGRTRVSEIRFTAVQTWVSQLTSKRGPVVVLARSWLTEDRLAKKLNITRELLAETSFRLWQRSFGEERDRRSGADANAQLRGQVSRSLQAEIEE